MPTALDLNVGVQDECHACRAFAAGGRGAVVVGGEFEDMHLLTQELSVAVRAQLAGGNRIALSHKVVARGI